MKCVGCLEETESYREEMAGDSKTLHICPTSLSLSSSDSSTHFYSESNHLRVTGPFIQSTPIKPHPNIHATGTHASEERAGESGEAGRSAGAELPESLASGPGLPHGEGEVLGTSARAAGQ